MSKIIVIVCCIIASACSTEVSVGEINRAMAACSNKGGVEKFTAEKLIVDVNHLYTVKCNNNDVIFVNRKN